MVTMRRAFVIHIHEGYGRLHYDLMLAHGDALATWELLSCPVGMKVGEALPARKLPDHRTAYLDYEGPVSGERGSVSRLERGSYELLVQIGERWEFRLEGSEIRVRYELRRGAPQGESWALRRLPDQ